MEDPYLAGERPYVDFFELARRYQPPAAPAQIALVVATAVDLGREPGNAENVEQLIKEAGDGARACLEAVSYWFVDRLRRCSYDFDATVGVRLVIAALRRVP